MSKSFMNQFSAAKRDAAELRKFMGDSACVAILPPPSGDLAMSTPTHHQPGAQVTEALNDKLARAFVELGLARPGLGVKPEATDKAISLARGAIVEAQEALAHPITTSDTGGVAEAAEHTDNVLANSPYPREELDLARVRTLVDAALSHSAAGQSVGGAVAVVVASVPHLRSLVVRPLPDVPLPPVDAVLYATPQPQRQSAAVGEAVTDGEETLWQHMMRYAEAGQSPTPARVKDWAYRLRREIAALAAPAQPVEAPEGLIAMANLFHDTYERLAPSYGYETRPDTKKFDQHSKNGRLMIATLRALRFKLGIQKDGE